MKIVTFNLDIEDGLVNLTIQPSSSKTIMELSMPLTVELEECILKQAMGSIKALMSEKSDLTGNAAKLP